MIRLTTLGRLDLTGSEGQVVRSVLQQPKRLALLIYLALEADEGFVRRDTVLGLFWPEHDEERARNALNQALHYLRRSLGKDAIVSRGIEDIGVADDVLVCDAVEFGRLLDAGRRPEALALYHGDFLRGFYIDGVPEWERWLDRRRTRLRTLAARAAWALADDEAEAGNRPVAVHWARRAAEFSPYDESAVRRLMRMLDATGDRAGALRAFDGFVRRLDADLDAEPSEETRALTATLRSRAAEEEAGEAEPEESAGGSGSPSTVDRAEGASTTAADADDEATVAFDRRPPGRSAADAVADGGRGRAAGPATNDGGHRWPLRRLALVALIAAVVVALWVLPDAPVAQPETSTAPGPTRIAVLRFDDFSPDGEFGYLADALSTTLIEQLAAVPALEIVARNGRVAPVARTVGLDSARSDLDVDLIISGNVIRAENVIRVSVQLIEARSHTTRKTFSVEREAGNLFSLLDGVAQELSSALLIQLGRQVQLARWRAGTDNVEAWELLQRAQWYRDRAIGLEASGAFPSAEAALLEADSLLSRAEALDPDWVEPTILRGRTAEQLGWLFFVPPLRDDGRFERHWREGVRHATRALRREPDDAAALELRGALRHLLWHFAPGDSAEVLVRAAERDLRRAIEHDDSRARALNRLSALLAARGRFSEANLTAERAYAADAYLEDVYEILARLVTTSLELDDIDAARRWCDEIGRRMEHGVLGAHCQLLILARGDPPDSIQVPDVWTIVEDARIPAHLRPMVRPPLDLLAATVLARIGWADSARAVVERTPSAPDNPELLWFQAVARTALGDERTAIRLIRRYVNVRPSLHAGVLRSRVFDRLRDQPDFPTPQPIDGAETMMEHR